MHLGAIQLVNWQVGDFYGEVDAVLKTPHPYVLEANTDCKLIRIYGDDLATVLATNADLDKNVRKQCETKKLMQVGMIALEYW